MYNDSSDDRCRKTKTRLLGFSHRKLDNFDDYKIQAVEFSEEQGGGFTCPLDIGTAGVAFSPTYMEHIQRRTFGERHTVNGYTDCQCQAGPPPFP